MIVRLTWREIRLATFAANDQTIFHMHNATPDPHGFGKSANRWEINIRGVLAEFAVCKQFDLYWPGAMPKREVTGDAARFEVRATTHDLGGLVVTKRDDDERPFILVVVDVPRFHLRGWMPGRDAKRDRWWKPEWEAYRVPQPSLRDMAEFVDPLKDTA